MPKSNLRLNPNRPPLWLKVFAFANDRGAEGVITQEVVEFFEGAHSHEAISPRLKELVECGMLLRKGKRPTRKGNLADVFVVVKGAHPMMWNPQLHLRGTKGLSEEEAKVFRAAKNFVQAKRNAKTPAGVRSATVRLLSVLGAL